MKLKRNDFLISCVADLLKHYKVRDFVQMEFDYDEILILKKVEHCSGTVFFTEVTNNNKIIVPPALLKSIEYNGEPVMVSTYNNINLLSFDILYTGATMEECDLLKNAANIIEIISIPCNSEIRLNKKCMEALNITTGDIIIMQVITNGFFCVKIYRRRYNKFYII